MSDDALLESQIAYYRAHAPRYDDWWFREDRHDLGDAYRDSWNAQIRTLRAALTELAPLGNVLELAGGTGNWTRELAMLADSVTVVDASPEAVAIARDKGPRPTVQALRAQPNGGISERSASSYRARSAATSARAGALVREEVPTGTVWSPG